MSPLARLFCGLTLLTVPSILYGGWFLLQIRSGAAPFPLTEFQAAMFRAGHGHAGVLVLFSLVAQLLADHARLPQALVLTVRAGFPLAALLVSGGFFGGAAGHLVRQPQPLVVLLYAGALLLAVCLVVLGVGLVRRCPPGTTSR